WHEPQRKKAVPGNLERPFERRRGISPDTELAMSAGCKYACQPQCHQQAGCRFGNALSCEQLERKVLRMSGNSHWAIGIVNIKLRHRVGLDELLIDCCSGNRIIGKSALNGIILEMPNRIGRRSLIDLAGDWHRRR